MACKCHYCQIELATYHPDLPIDARPKGMSELRFRSFQAQAAIILAAHTFQTLALSVRGRSVRCSECGVALTLVGDYETALRGVPPCYALQGV